MDMDKYLIYPVYCQGENKMVTFNKKAEQNNKDHNKKESKKEETNTSFTNPLQQIFASNDTNQRTLIDAEKIIESWLSKKHLRMKTSLSQNQINSIASLETMAKQFHLTPLRNLIFNFIMYMISKESESATQLVNILQSKGLLDSNELATLSKFTK